MNSRNTKQELLAEIESLRLALIERGYRALWRAIQNSCPKCGHDTTEDGCANCLIEDLNKWNKLLTDLKRKENNTKFYLHKY